MMRAFAFDTETTGLIKNRTIKLALQPEVIEFCGVDFDLDSGEVFARHEFLIRPLLGISQEITDITHLDMSDLSPHPPMSVTGPLIKKVLEEASLVIAHNASFDIEMIDINMERLGVKVEWPRVICTVEQTINLKGYRLSMTDLHILLFNEQFANAHRAGPDVDALVRCCIELRKRGIL